MLFVCDCVCLCLCAFVMSACLLYVCVLMCLDLSGLCFELSRFCGLSGIYVAFSF